MVGGGTFVKFLTIFFVKKTTSPYISLYHNYQNSKIKNLTPHPIPYILYHIPFIYPIHPLNYPTHIFYPITNKNPIEVNLRGSIPILLYYIFQSSEAISSTVSSCGNPSLNIMPSLISYKEFPQRTIYPFFIACKAL